MRIGIAQINTTVGDIAANQRKILEAYARLVKDGAELVVFPETVVCGYPPRDLLFKRQFVPDVEKATREIAAKIGDVPAFVGTVETNRTGQGRPFHNSAAFCRRGAIELMARKCLLPTYDVFDEDRYFEPATEPVVATFDGYRIGITICEDLWTHPTMPTRRLYHGVDPTRQLIQRGCDLAINLSASPWYLDKDLVRRRLVTDAAAGLGCPLVYVNQVGGNDELIFDGRSLVSDATGRVVGGLRAFAEDFRVVDVAVRGNPAASVQAGAIDRTFDQPEMADVYDALVLGLRDYAHKSGFTTALVALSGGIDSAIVGVIAADAFGPANVTGISLPSSISSQHSRDDAAALAKALGIRFETIAIAGTVSAFESALAPLFAGTAPGVAEENIQARARGTMMMALSNKFNSLLLTTGNKSEIAVGYCTLYGDMAGGLAVISDVFKMQVYELSRWVNADAVRRGRPPPIPRSTIEKPPSAELRPGQVDQDSLPPYEILDRILKGYVEEGLSRRDLVAAGFDRAVVDDVVRKVDRNEYKRKQAAPGLKITPLAFGVGRRIPIVQRYVD